MVEQTRLVGRTAEVAALEEEWKRAAGGELRCVLLSGAPGVGKTRLAQELVEGVAGRAIVLSARARPLGGVAAFGLWAEALEDHLRELPANEVTELRGGLLDDLACVLRSVAAVRGDAPEGEAPSPPTGEPGDAAAEPRPATAALVMATARPGELADEPLAVRVLLDLEQQGRLRRLPIEPLPEPALRELTADMLGSQAGQDVVAWVAERSRGNALFAVGLLLTLREEGGTPRPGLR
jgi:hypothetical protein